MKTYVIFSPPYDEIRGGSIVLHKLCHLINQQGRQAYIFPLFENFEINQLNYKKLIPLLLRRTIRWKFKPYRTNPKFRTPIVRSIAQLGNWEDIVVVYPEVTFGNPLNAKHVVRWLLHNPGHLKGKFFYGADELHYKISSQIKDFYFPGSTLSNLELRITHYPIELYAPPTQNIRRSGTAYCLRKGRHKPIQHDIKNSILIDGKKHKEVAEIFKHVQTFISYDTYTAYSRLAAFAGCDSVVIPDKEVTIDEWQPKPEERIGIAYGFENLAHAQNTKFLVAEKFDRLEKEAAGVVKKFIEESEIFFNSNIEK